MRRLIAGITLFFLILTSISTQAQDASIKGIVTDTANAKKLENAVVSLLRRSDSVLVKFTRTNKSGEFNFTKLPAGDFVILISYPSFADFVDPIQLK